MAECCGSGTKLIYACSGAADVGEIADRVTRKLRKEGDFLMTCLAGIGAGLSGYVQSAKGADENITIDGCPVACARKTLERIGVTPTSYILTDLGLVKGESPVSEKIVDLMCEKIKKAKGSKTVQERTITGGCGCGGKC
ncbi:MAG: DGC domain protein [Smithella sp. PtaU1.Bin162]|nr:MAG: DGC domain protein [Smithella sp. PtaU1.Bin162]